jgi:ribonucleotide reductase alpha subunit
MKYVLEDLKKSGDAPQWMDESGLKTLLSGYLLPDETPKQMYSRVAKAAASYYSNKKEWEKKFFDAMWKNWLCPASPILSNMSVDRGLPISCNSISVSDSVDSIFTKNYELAILGKNGAGVGIFMGNIRARGETIKGNGKSEGSIPWCKTFDVTTLAISQGGVRRLSSAVYLPIDHGDIEEFINIRRPVGDINRRCLNLNHGVCISDAWMESMLAGDRAKRKTWENLLLARVETGEPYIFFTDNVNKNNPECYTKNNLNVETSNICCLSGNTLVATKNGAKRIIDLVGKEVEIYDGKKWITTDSFKMQGEAELFRIYTADGNYTDATANHRWFVANSYEDIRNKTYRETLTSNLDIGQYIEYHKIETHGNVCEPGAYIKGFLCGDGTHTKNRPLLNLHFPKFMCADELIASANEIVPSKPNTNAITEMHFGGMVNYTNKNEALGRQEYKTIKGMTVRGGLYEWTHPYKNHMPDEIYTWSKQSKMLFLSGLLDADGTVHKNTIQISNKSGSFIYDLGLMLKTCGISFSRDKIKDKEFHRITISATDSFQLKNELSCKRLNLNVSKPNRFLTTFRKIVKIEKLEGNHPVYCPTIPTTGKFALANGLMTGNSEITLYTDPDHTFVCCLSSLNLVRWEEWKDTDLVNTAVRFLDAVLSEYIEKTENMKGMEASRRSAIKGRAIGIGVLGWHTLLQEKGLPFDSFDTMQLNAQIFKSLREKADEESAIMAKELGEPEWCKGFGRRHTHCLAVAPTVSNSTISGGHSAGIEPFAANIFVQKSAKGTFIRKNTTLEKLLEAKEKNTLETWASINEKSGSVQHLACLTPEEKEVFLTAREINQHTLIKLAAQRQKWIDQGQSLNLFFASNSSAKYIHDVHIAAWKSGLKTLYYLRSEGVIKSDLASRSENECKACEA